MLLTAFHMWHWLSKYGRFQVHKMEWKNYESNSISTKQKKIIHKMEIQSKSSKQQYLIVVVHHLCDDPLYGKGNFFP